MNRRTIVVEGPLAFRMRHIAAARDGELGIQIMTLPLLAARLAGGFIEPALHPQLLAAIRLALDEGKFRELEGLRLLPGTPRSVFHTLMKIWQSDISLSECSARHARLADLAVIEQRVCAHLPAGTLAPRELRNAAMDRIEHAASVIGSVELERLASVRPCGGRYLPRWSGTCRCFGVIRAQATPAGTKDCSLLKSILRRPPSRSHPAPILARRSSKPCAGCAN
jgi:hypothetical protein